MPVPVAFLAMLAAVLLTSCRQKDLVWPDEMIRVMVDFDWLRAEGAVPEGMTVLFFPADGDFRSWRFDIPGRDGGEVELFPGQYRVIAYNNDLPGVLMANTDNYDTCEATVRMMTDTLSHPTGMLYGAHLSSVTVGNNHGRLHTITLTPDSLATVYHILVDSVSGTQRIKTARAIINGIASSVCLQQQLNSENTCCISTNLQISSLTRSTLEAVTTGFGNPPVPNPRITLDVVVTTTHAVYKKSFDVTDQVMNSSNLRDVNIYIKGMDIPEADTPGNPDDHDVGISVGVDGWQVIEITYS